MNIIIDKDNKNSNYTIHCVSKTITDIIDCNLSKDCQSTIIFDAN